MRRIVLLAVVACGRIGFDPIPITVEINGRATYAIAPMLSVGVETDLSQAEIRVVEADANGACASRYADDGWQPYTPSFVVLRHVEPVDGVKRMCVWARSGGRISLATDSIIYQTANLPVIATFSVVNAATGQRMSAAGDPLRISWMVSDVEGLAAAPIDLYYTTDPVGSEQWLPLAIGIGDARSTPLRYMASIDTILAPTDAPFRVKLVARDIAGNRSVAALSDAMNVTDWSVYAGSTDRGIGGVGRGAALLQSSNGGAGYAFSIDPVTQDIYASDDGSGIARLDARTGDVSQVVRNGVLNLPDDGPLTAGSSIPLHAALHVGPDGKLYVAGLWNLTDTAASGVIYQIDVAASRVRRYLGGGIQNAPGATATEMFIYPWVWNFDEDGSLYFFTRCSTGTFGVTSAMRLMKLTQNADGTPGTVSIVAGDCTRATPAPGPTDALASSVGDIQYPHVGSIAPWDHGRRIYYAFYGTGAWKILDGQIYRSDIEIARTGSIAYDRVNGVLVAPAADGSLVAYQPNLAGVDGDMRVRIVASASGTGRCADDGIDADAACVHAGYTNEVGADGTLYFMDGPAWLEARPYRIRFVDTAHRLRTYFGAPPFHGDGLDRRVARGQFVGIRYKDPSAPNQLAFPSALYFVDPESLVFGHVDDADHIVIDWGNQSGAPITLATGAPIGPDVGLGRAYAGGTMFPLAFDDTGLPWLRYDPIEFSSALVSIDASRRVVARQAGGATWDAAADGTDPASLELWPYAFSENLTLIGDRAIAIGGYQFYTTAVVLKMLDFGTHTLTRLMGVAPNGFSPDNTTPGIVRSLSLPQACFTESLRCFTRYQALDDRIYYSEDQRIRYITTPTNPATSTLGTLWTKGGGESLQNFTFSPDGSQLFYILGGSLLCHDLSSGKPWCNDTPLGPPPLIFKYIDAVPDELTWKAPGTLFVSGATGVIYEYTLPP